MSEKRTILSRPRTRVYDCNYSIGEKYYKPMVEKLDLKYSSPSGAISGGGSSSLFGGSAPLFNSSAASNRLNNDIDDNFDFAPIKRPTFTSDLEGPGFESSQATAARSRFTTLEEDLEDEIANSVRKLKALRASRARSTEKELSPSNYLNGVTKQKKLNLSEKILDSVGVNGKLQDSLEGEILKKRTVKMPTLFDNDDTPTPTGLTKWTPLTKDSFKEDFFESAAKARARQSKARLADIENDIEEVTQKGLARERRISKLKSLIAGEDPFADNEDSSYKKSSSLRVDKVSKKVTF